MNQMIETISRAILKKNFADCNVNELRELTKQYPYFPPLHALLSAKLKSDNDEGMQIQYQKTSLYFNNNLWLDYLLSGPATVVKTHAIEQRGFEAEPTIDTKSFVTGDESNSPEIIEIIPDPVKEEEQHISPFNNDLREGFKDNTRSDLQLANEEESKAEYSSEEKNEPDQEDIKIPQIKISPVDPSTALTFEPFHTVDYFASQGIKMKEENKPTDRFSQQLKSFTEWLKTMKKIPEITRTGDSASEQKVEQMAAISITDREVVTEAMAEVWEKQGEKAKAREIYSKLSLLDPSKSAYFAAKIESLK